MTVRDVQRVFRFSFRLVRRSRRTKVFTAVGLLPVVLAVILQIARAAAPGRGLDGLAIFGDVVLSFGLQFLVLLLALFYGTSVTADEVDNKTLTYLTTRPVPKAAILLGKAGASVAFLLILVLGSTTAAFFILNFDRLGYGPAWDFLWRSLAALALGTLCYTAFFTLVGTFLRKSILFGLFFGFGWENVVQYFPGTTQRFTIVHYLKSILPGAGTGPSGGKLAFLTFGLEPSPAPAAVAILLVLTAAFAVLACRVFAGREYLFDE